MKSKIFVKGLSSKIQNNMKMLENKTYGLVEEKSKLSLIKIKETEYSKFQEFITPLILEIGKKSLTSILENNKSI